MSTTYRKIIESGAARICFVWHVHGYPWAVCSEKTLVDLVDEPSSDTDAQFIRRKIFGPNSIGGIYPADTAPLFPTLMPNSLGIQTTKCDSVGFADVSSWKIDIHDQHLGADYEYLASGDQVWGIDGLHRTPNLNREIHGWGFLSENLKTDDDSLAISDESSYLFDRISDISTWKPLWIGQECIAVTGVSSGGAHPDYSIDIGSRGLYRSKNQYHFTSPLEGVSQKIADIPPSIAGHYCTLYAIPITDQGGFFYDSGSDPIIAIERAGMVSKNIGTNAGVTTVQILGTFEGLSNEIEKTTTGHLDRYVLCRGQSGTRLGTIDGITSIPELRQMPHLMICEYYQDPYHPTTIGWWEYKPVWLCERGQTIRFSTVDDMVDRINEELKYLYEESASQTTGSDATPFSENERVSLRYKYRITKEILVPYIDDDGNYYDRVQSSEPMWFLSQETGTPYNDSGYFGVGGKWSMVGGICQVILGLGVPKNPDLYKVPSWIRGENNFTLDSFEEENMLPLLMSLSHVDNNPFGPSASGDGNDQFMPAVISGQYFNSMGEAVSQAVHPGPHSFMVPAGLCNRTEVWDLEAPDDFFVAPYCYQWDWINYTILTPDGNIPFIGDEQWTTDGVLHCLKATSGSLHFGLTDDTITDFFPDGTIVRLGKYTGTLYGFSSDSTGKLMVMSEELTADSISQCGIGTSLIFVPAYAVDEDKEDDAINDDWNPDADDPYTITSGRSFSGENIVDVIKAFLGYTDTDVYIPYHERRLWIPFFRTDAYDGTTSMIDWDSLSDLTDSGFCKSSRVIVPKSGFNLRNAFDAELKLYGLGMAADWDDSTNQTVYRFRQYGDIVTSYTLSLGRVLSNADLIAASVDESHLDIPIFNKINLSYIMSGTDEKYKIAIRNRDVFSQVQRDALTLSVSPIFTQFDLNAVDLEESNELYDRLLPFLIRASEIKPTQKRPVAFFSRFRSTPGREILLTDPAGAYPQTHQRGLVSAPCLVTSQSIDLGSGVSKISYLVAGDSAVHGYAPSCRCDVSEVSLNADGFTCTPDQHYGTTWQQPEDIYFFDCFDLSDSTNPGIRTCTCSNYAVLVYAQDEAISSENPIPGTCSAVYSGGEWNLRIYCDESLLPSQGKLIITFAEYDDCEPCQQSWIFFSDNYGTVGTDAKRGDTWR